jgi:hypothetical protein
MGFDVPFGLALPVTHEAARHDAAGGQAISAADEQV